MKLFVKRAFIFASLTLWMLFVSCSDDSDGLFLSQIKGKSFESIENEYIIHDGKKLIKIEGTLLTLYTEEDQDCWERMVPPFRLIDNFQYDAWFKSVVDNGGLVRVTKREDGGVRINLWGNDFEAIRINDYCSID